MKKYNQSKRYENKGFIKQKPAIPSETLEELFTRYDKEDAEILWEYWFKPTYISIGSNYVLTSYNTPTSSVTLTTASK